MLYLTKKEIDKKFFQVISSYEKVLSSLKENKYSDISYNLDLVISFTQGLVPTLISP